MNIIEIRGIRGLIVAGMVCCCLFAGFVVFPGWICMLTWDYISEYSAIPAIGLFQGVLLWGILVASYFTFAKRKVLVCFKSPKGLSDEELKKVFENVKKQSELDPVMKAMLKSKETELKIKAVEAEENKVEDTTSETTQV